MSYDSKYTGAEVEALLDQMPDKLGKTEKAADSAKLGGVAAADYATSANVPTLALQGKIGQIPRAAGTSIPAGWYRIGVTTRTTQRGWTFRMMLRRHFNNRSNETYIIDAAIGYASGAASHVYFTQVAGGDYNNKFIDKVRVTVANDAVSYIDLHISADCANNIEYFLDGDAGAYAEGTIVAEETATTYEFSTVNGLASSHGITATKLATPRSLWGQSFDGSGDINGLITSSGSNTDIGLRATGSTYNLLFGIGGSNINRGIYDTTNGNWIIYRDDTNNVLFPSGNVGIGTTSPTEKLDVVGNAIINGKLTAVSGAFNGEVSFNAIPTTDICQGVRANFKTGIAQISDIIGNYFYLGKEATDKYIRFRKYSSISLQAPSDITDLMTIDTSGNVKATNFIGALARPLQDHGTGDTTFTLTPNILHQWGTVSSLTLTLGGGVDGTVNEYTFQFTSGTTATTLSLPSSVKFPSELTIEANKIYQISIVNNLALISSWDA